MPKYKKCYECGKSMSPAQARACVTTFDEIFDEGDVPCCPYSQEETDNLAEEMVVHAQPTPAEKLKGRVLSCSSCMTQLFKRAGVKPR